MTQSTSLSRSKPFLTLDCSPSPKPASSLIQIYFHAAKISYDRIHTSLNRLSTASGYVAGGVGYFAGTVLGGTGWSFSLPYQMYRQIVQDKPRIELEQAEEETALLGFHIACQTVIHAVHYGFCEPVSYVVSYGIVAPIFVLGAYLFR
jgi:hypothetical protein